MFFSSSPLVGTTCTLLTAVVELIQMLSMKGLVSMALVNRERIKTAADKVNVMRLQGLSEQTDIPMSKLLDEALEDLFEKYGEDPKQYVIIRNRKGAGKK